MYSLPELTAVLIASAEMNLPKFSGHKKMLEIIVQFNYGPYKKELGLPSVIEDGEENSQHIKILFWHPSNAMVVAYDSERHIDDIGILPYIVSANHSSTWKYDGLNFFHKILEKPKSYKILTEKIIDVDRVQVNDTELTYTEIQQTASIN